MKDADRRQAISARIKELRGRRGMTQPQVADAVDVSLRTYQNWEAGGGTSGENYERLGEVLGASYDYLMTGGDVMPPTADVLGRLDHLQASVDRILERLEAAEVEREILAAVQASGEGSSPPETGEGARSTRRAGGKRRS